MRSFFGVDWQNPLIYHLVLNTGSVPIETCVTIVRLLAERPEFQEAEETRSVLADKLVELRVRAALGDAFATPVDIRVEKGKVTLTGTTMGPIGNVEEVVRSVPGVTDVENRVMVVRAPALPEHVRRVDWARLAFGDSRSRDAHRALRSRSFGIDRI